MLWIKAFHIIFMVTWFAGLFYLPRLFVYHTEANDEISLERFKVMERRLCYAIMTPGALLTIILGFWLIALVPADLTGGWLHAKLALVGLCVIYHIMCIQYVRQFKHDRNQHSTKFYRWFNEVPTVLLIAIIILAEVRPF